MQRDSPWPWSLAGAVLGSMLGALVLAATFRVFP